MSYIIAGPTASGKSDFAHALAARVGGTIINCDSVQIYRGIEAISASPFANRAGTDEIDGVPYKLFSILDLSTQISVADYLEMARGAYDATIATGRVPIFVGGTGYYINAILNGISPMPEIDADVRARAREMVASDPNGARQILGPNAPADPQRMSRALEVLLQTGRPISDFQSAPRVGAIVPRPRVILISPDTADVHERIAARIPKMLDAGAAQEARTILENKWDETRAIGAMQLCEYLRGNISRDACIENWITKTRQYAKRQRTWFRTQLHADITLNGDEEIAAVLSGQTL